MKYSVWTSTEEFSPIQCICETLSTNKKKLRGSWQKYLKDHEVQSLVGYHAITEDGFISVFNERMEPTKKCN